MAKNLILYYSRKGENYVDGNIQELPKGNTEICVGYIQEAVGGDVFEVDTVKQYPNNYMTCIEVAKQELNETARPELKEELASIEDYDTVFVCGPCWWGTYPMAMFTQLEKLDFNGKKVLPLMTHEGSGLRHCEADLKDICIGAVFAKGLAVHGADVKEAKEEVQAWAKENL